MKELIRELVKEALEEAGRKPLTGAKLRNAMGDIWANKELFNLETFDELPEELRKYYLKTRRDTKSFGEGSSRYVYKVGPDRVIKVGKGTKGAAQNKAEVDAETCGHQKYYAEVYEHANDYSWIISELAKPVSKKELESLLTVDLDTLYSGLMSLWDQTHGTPKEEQHEDEFKIYKRLRRSSWLRGLLQMIENCDLEPADVVKASSWGVRKNGKPILIDYGLGSEVYDTYYSEG